MTLINDTGDGADLAGLDFLIAEDFLLMLLDDVTGHLAGASTLHYTLGGAVLLELALADRAEIVTPTSGWRWPKVETKPGTDFADPILREAFGVLAEKPRITQDALLKLGVGLQEKLIERLLARGVLREQSSKWLGLFRVRTWPAHDGRHEEELRARIRRVLVDGAVPDDRTAAVIALLSASNVLGIVLKYEGDDARTARKRAAELAKGHESTVAVKDLVDSAAAAVIASTSAAVGAAIAAAVTSATN